MVNDMKRRDLTLLLSQDEEERVKEVDELAQKVKLGCLCELKITENSLKSS
jgi:hypothetical protein